MMADGHRYFIDVDGADGVRLRVECPWRAHPTMVARVCWPRDLDGKPDPAPQPICTYQQWAEAVHPSEILHGSFTIEVGCTPAWDAGSLELTIVRTVRSWCTTPQEQPTLTPTPRREVETVHAKVLGAESPHASG